MPYGNLNLQMRGVLAEIVKGQTVYDLGAGDCDHARTLIQCGATEVVCIDKEPLPVTPPIKSGITFIEGYVANVPIPENLEVVFLGWPLNYHIPGLLSWMRAAKTVIYLGCNFDGTACGFPEMFEHLRMRRLSRYVPSARNSLIVVDALLSDLREMTPEEAAAFSEIIIHS